VVARPEVEVSTGVGVVHEVELGEDTVCAGRMMGDRIISRAGGSREEAIDVLFTRSDIEIVTTHTPSSVEEGVVVEETGELC